MCVRREILLLIQCVSVVVLVLATTDSIAYVDPGTTSVVFGFVGYILALLGTVLAFLLWPLKRLFRRLFKKPSDGKQTTVETSGQ